MASKTSARALLSAERRVQALALRRTGATYTQIAKTLGVARNAAWKMVTQELEKLRRECAESAEEIRALELDRLDSALAVVWEVMKDSKKEEETISSKGGFKSKGGKSKAEMRLLAVDRLIKIMDRRARYLGLDDAPPEDDLGDKLFAHYEAALAKVYGEKPTPKEGGDDAAG